MARAARLISGLLATAASGAIVRHLADRSRRARTSPHSYQALKQTLAKERAPVFSAVEGGALMASLVSSPEVRENRRALYLTLVGSASLLAMMGVWAIMIRPIGRQVEGWTEASVPMNWQQTKERWERLQKAETGLSLVGLGALVAAKVLEKPSRNGHSEAEAESKAEESL